MRTLTRALSSVFVLLCGVGVYTYLHFVSQSSASPPVPLDIKKDRFYQSVSAADTQQATFFWIHGVNYYPQRQPWSLFWRQYSPEIVEKDLALIHQLGFNTVRIFLPYTLFQDERHEAALRHFLNAAEAQHLKCILTLFDFYQDYAQPEQAVRYLERLVPRFQNSPALLAWDLKNELDRDQGAFSAGVLQQWLDRLVPHLKRLDPEHWVTLGWSEPEAMLRFRAAVDYDTFHYYGRPEAFQSRLQAVKEGRHQQGIRRPLVMGEFGYHTWREDPRDPHFSEHQFNYVMAMMAGRLSAALSGSLFWDLYDYPRNLTEDWVLQSPSFQYHMGLIDTEGKPKPGLKALQATVFLRDAESQGEITLNTRVLEAVFYSQQAGAVFLEWSSLETADGVAETAPQRHKSWQIDQGLNRLRWQVSAAEIQALIYLRSQYTLVTPPLLNLAGVPSASHRHLLSLRLR